MILLDSNAWIYYFDESLPEHSKATRTLGKRLAEERLLTSPLIQLEVVHYLVRRLSEQAEPLVSAYFDLPTTCEPLTNGDALEASGVLLAEHSGGIGSRDAAILVLAKRTGAELVTADKPLKRVAQRMGIATSSPV